MSQADNRQEDRVRVLRIIEYEGPRSWVELTVSMAIHGRRQLTERGGGGTITAVTIDAFPRILEEARYHRDTRADGDDK